MSKGFRTLRRKADGLYTRVKYIEPGRTFKVRGPNGERVKVSDCIVAFAGNGGEPFEMSKEQMWSEYDEVTQREEAGMYPFPKPAGFDATPAGPGDADNT